MRILVWNRTNKTVTVNGKTLTPEPRHTLRRSIDYFEIFKLPVKQYYFVYFDANQFRKREKSYLGVRLHFHLNATTATLGCPKQLHKVPYNLLTFLYDKKKNRYYAECSNIDMNEFLNKHPIGAHQVPSRVNLGRRELEHRMKRISVFRVTPANIKMNIIKR